jgi:hypothetical protein
VPTPESAAAFARLLEARTRLNDLSVELRDALDARGHSTMANERYRELQQRWDEAFRAFEAATEDFAACVKRMHDDIEAHRQTFPPS